MSKLKQMPRFAWVVIGIVVAVLLVPSGGGSSQGRTQVHRHSRDQRQPGRCDVGRAAADGLGGSWRGL